MEQERVRAESALAAVAVPDGLAISPWREGAEGERDAAAQAAWLTRWLAVASLGVVVATLLA